MFLNEITNRWGRRGRERGEFYQQLPAPIGLMNERDPHSAHLREQFGDVQMQNLPFESGRLSN
jgi:hypothetical protein